MNSPVGVQFDLAFGDFDDYQPMASWADMVEEAQAEGSFCGHLKLPSWADVDLIVEAKDPEPSPGELSYIFCTYNI